MRIPTTTKFLSSSKSLILQEIVLCQQFVRKLAVTPKKQKKTVSLKKLFPHVVKTGHSDPDIVLLDLSQFFLCNQFWPGTGETRRID